MLAAGTAVGAAAVAVPGLAACAPPPATPTSPPPGPLTGLGAVPVGGTTVVTGANGAPVAVTRVRADAVVAHSAVCTHQGCTVAAAGPTLSCPCHGSVFDAASGAVEQGPATRALPAIPVHVQGDSVVVDAGAPR